MQARAGDAEPLGRDLEIAARMLGLRQEVLSAGRPLLEQVELAGDRASRPLALPPERDAAHDHDEEADEPEHESDQKRSQNHAGSLGPGRTAEEAGQSNGGLFGMLLGEEMAAVHRPARHAVGDLP